MNRIVEAVKANKGLIVKGLIAVGAIVTTVVVAGALKKDEEITMEGQAIIDAFTNEPELDIQPITEE